MNDCRAELAIGLRADRSTAQRSRRPTEATSQQWPQSPWATLDWCSSRFACQTLRAGQVVWCRRCESHLEPRPAFADTKSAIAKLTNPLDRSPTMTYRRQICGRRYRSTGVKRFTWTC